MRARLLLLGLLGLTACPRLDPMNTGENKRKAYQSSDQFADGLAMRHPPAGTVPFRSARDPVVETGLGPDGRPVAEAPLQVREIGAYQWADVRVGRYRRGPLVLAVLA